MSGFGLGVDFLYLFLLGNLNLCDMSLGWSKTERSLSSFSCSRSCLDIKPGVLVCVYFLRMACKSLLFYYCDPRKGGQWRETPR
jgi:hypothetical protein